MGYKIDEIEGIGPAYRAKLAAAKIQNTEQLLGLCCDARGRKAVSASTGISEKLLLEWANMADLMRISGIGRQYSELLEASGVDTVKELSHRKADNLAAKMSEVNTAKKLAKSSPSATTVAEWIAQAKALPPKITH